MYSNDEQAIEVIRDEVPAAFRLHKIINVLDTIID
jgi:hypothetical protein